MSTNDARNPLSVRTITSENIWFILNYFLQVSI